MRLHRFYLSEPIASKTEIILDDNDVVHQIRKVFRLRKSDLLIVFDGSGTDYTCAIEDFRDDSIVLAVREASKSRFMPQKQVILYAAIVKKDTFEWIVEKATELGVSKIVPVVAERTEKKSINEDRLKKIAIEASEQSGRGNVPEVAPVVPLKVAVSNLNGKAVAFHIGAELFKDSDAESESIACFIGPEGGWSPDEIALFHEHKIPVRSIGNQVLRAETAVVATLSLVMLSK